MKQTRNILKTYFETGDFPTQVQFEELIDSYAHLNEFNFGLSVKPSGVTLQKFYHFYTAQSIQFSGRGHQIVEAAAGSTPDPINNYNHVLSRNVLYKRLQVNIEGEIDIELHQPKIIVERYKQRKKMASGYVKPAGYYKEKTDDANSWNRKSEYLVTSSEMFIDLEPIHYYRPKSNYGGFLPSGSLGKSGSFRYSKHGKPFVPIRLKLQIKVDGVNYESRPLDFKIMLGSAGLFDAINYLF